MANMSDFDCPPPPADDWIDRWVQIDEQLVADNDTGRHESTAAGGDSVEGELADCLGLLDRLRRHTTLWPGESASWQWLYREDLTPQRIGRFEIAAGWHGRVRDGVPRPRSRPRSRRAA